MSPRKFCSALAVSVLAAAGAVALAAVPAGASGKPGVPTGLKVASATKNSFTVTAHKVAHAKKYVVFAAKSKSDIVYQNLSRPDKNRHEASATHPSVTIKGLAYTSAVFYYRMEAKNGSGGSITDIKEAYLAPPRPSGVTGVHPDSAKTGVALKWDVQENVVGYQVEQAQDRKFSKHVKIYTLHGKATEFTPYGLTKGTQYYFRVRSVSGTSKSRYSGTVPLVMNAHELPLRVLTYNVLHKILDGRKENGNTIAPWSKRLPKIIALIKMGDPDVATINEASDYVKEGKTRSIDTILAKLPGYSLARTETFPDPLNPRTGNYILYKTSEFKAIDVNKSHKQYWTVSHKNWVAYQILQSKTTGARFLTVSVHLSHGPNSVDKKRGQEAKVLLKRAEGYAKSHGNIPIVYAGDFNSFSGPDPATRDTPERELRAHHVGDAYVAAQKRQNLKYGSVNAYERVPSKTGRVIDHVFGEAGVAFHDWNQLLKLKHGKFVGTIPSDHNPVYADISIQY